MTMEMLEVLRLVMSVAPFVVLLILLQRLSARVTDSLQRMTRRLDEQHAVIIKHLESTWADEERAYLQEMAERDRRADARAQPREPGAAPVALLVTR